MQNIIYKSDNIIPWDTQSAFKMTSYNCHKEENMVFCYLKAYVHKNDLTLCSYCFKANPEGNKDIALLINLNPENTDKNLILTFGYDGISEVKYGQAGKEKVLVSDILAYSPFKADDEQGFYWCGQIVLSEELINKYFSTTIEEGNIINLNMVQNFSDGDYSVLCGDASEDEYDALENMENFVVMSY